MRSVSELLGFRCYVLLCAMILGACGTPSPPRSTPPAPPRAPSVVPAARAEPPRATVAPRAPGYVLAVNLDQLTDPLMHVIFSMAAGKPLQDLHLVSRVTLHKEVNWYVIVGPSWHSADRVLALVHHTIDDGMMDSVLEVEATPLPLEIPGARVWTPKGDAGALLAFRLLPSTVGMGPRELLADATYRDALVREAGAITPGHFMHLRAVGDPKVDDWAGRALEIDGTVAADDGVDLSLRIEWESAELAARGAERMSKLLAITGLDLSGTPVQTLLDGARVQHDGATVTLRGHATPDETRELARWALARFGKR